MSRRYLVQKAVANSAKVITSTIESGSLPLTSVQKRSPDEIVNSFEHTLQSRNFTLMGFERGAMRLQPFVGPKEI